MVATSPSVSEPKVKHSARWTPALLDRIAAILGVECERVGRRVVVLDNHAGTGERVAGHLGIQLCSDWLGIEIEPEWAAVSPWVLQGDSDHLPPNWFEAFGALVTSPDYGSRLADKHNAQDSSRRMSYTHDLRATTGDSTRDLAPTNTGGVQWGARYRAMHARRLIEAVRCVSPGGLVIINMSDHERDEVRQPVVAWWKATMDMIGLTFEKDWLVQTPRLRYGANHEARVEGEHLLVYRRPELDACRYEIEATQLQVGERTEVAGVTRTVERVGFKVEGRSRIGWRIQGSDGQLDCLKRDLITCVRNLR